MFVTPNFYATKRTMQRNYSVFLENLLYLQIFFQTSEPHRKKNLSSVFATW